MTVGRQFENTFWQDPDTNETHVWTRGTPQPNITPSGRPLHQITTFKRFGSSNIELGPSNEQLGAGSQGLQGLLFHPLTGTGLKGDSMVPDAMRRGTIQKALDLTSVEGYKKNLSNILGRVTSRSTRRNYAHKVERANISDKGAETHMRRLTDTLDQSDMPTHIIAKKETPTRTILDPLPGRAYAESSGTAIRLTTPHDSKTKTVISKETVSVPSDTPIGNPKFWSQLNKVLGDDHNSISADETFDLATHWVHPETGHVMTGEYAQNIPFVSEHKDAENPMDTPALMLRDWGYVPNLFPGKGNAAAKSHSVGKVGKIETGYGDFDRGDGYRRTTFHNRFTTSDKQEEKTIVKRVRHEPALNQEVMVHELGHAMDPNMGESATNRGKYNYGREKRTVIADPIEEGVADASADRYVRYKGQFQDTLANNEQRLKDFESSGYTTSYSGWKNKTQSALYAATRYHTALADNMSHPQQMPSRDQLIDALPEQERKTVRGTRTGFQGSAHFPGNQFLDTANSLALGHLYHHMPHVRGILKQAGLEDTALAAHADYKKRMGLDVQHPVLPGMEDFV
jgi:hypothetical protein